MTETYITEEDDGNYFEISYSKKYIYNDHNIFIVSWWGTDSNFNKEQIKIGDIEIMTATYGS